MENADTAHLRENLDRLKVLELPIYLSELDIEGSDQEQLDRYQRLFPVYWEHPLVQGVTLWGYRQGTMWRGNAYLVRGDGSERPALTWLKDYMKQAIGTRKDLGPLYPVNPVYRFIPNNQNVTTVLFGGCADLQGLAGMLYKPNGAFAGTASDFDPAGGIYILHREKK
jgi:hypothetical protein